MAAAGEGVSAAAQRVMASRLCADVEAAARFHERLLGLSRRFSSDWFVLLGAGAPGVELGFLARDHETVPAELREGRGGTLLTVVVADCDAVHARAAEMGAEVVSPPANTAYGQRRMIVRDPDGALLDVSSPTAPPPATDQKDTP